MKPGSRTVLNEIRLPESAVVIRYQKPFLEVCEYHKSTSVDFGLAPYLHDWVFDPSMQHVCNGEERDSDG